MFYSFALSGIDFFCCFDLVPANHFKTQSEKSVNLSTYVWHANFCFKYHSSGDTYIIAILLRLTILQREWYHRLRRVA